MNHFKPSLNKDNLHSTPGAIKEFGIMSNGSLTLGMAQRQVTEEKESSRFCLGGSAVKSGKESLVQNKNIQDRY